MLKNFNQYIYTKDVCDAEKEAISSQLCRMLKVRFRNNAPRRPPKILMIGPPGSGRSTQSQRIADAFGLVCISP